MSAPIAESRRIVLAGCTNSGKSTLINNLFERAVAIVSPEPGTTTDPVQKKMELGAAGPVSVVDTAGLDDATAIGELRIEQTMKELNSADLILLVTPLDRPVHELERRIVTDAAARNIPLVAAASFSDHDGNADKLTWLADIAHVRTDHTGTGINALREALIAAARQTEAEITPLEGIVREGDTILLVVPIDLAAPKGRLILPQVETIRDALDRDCAVITVKERELYRTYTLFRERPTLVITDSQAFSKTAADIAPDQPLTSFSILFARKKGDLTSYLAGTRKLETIGRKARVLIFESCAHHRAPDDIGTVKIPRLFRQMIASDAEFEFAHGTKAGIDYARYDLAIFCGGCMQTRRQMLAHIDTFTAHGVPVTNYGLFLAYCNGLLPRALEPFPHEYSLWTEGRQTS